MSRKRCSYSGCRKIQKNGAFCNDHQPAQKTESPLNSSTTHPIDIVVRATELECLRFCRADVELRNTLQAIRIKELEIDNLKKSYEKQLIDLKSALVERLQALERQRGELEVILESCKKVQLETVGSLAEKYGLDPAHMTIDPDTGVLRDLRVT